MRDLYDMLVEYLLWYNNFYSDIEDIGFEFNPYRPCVANQIVNKKHHTIRFHIDNLMSSHIDSEVNAFLLKWTNNIYGTYGEVQETHNKVHKYLAMTINFSDTGKVKFDMVDYIGNMID